MESIYYLACNVYINFHGYIYVYINLHEICIRTCMEYTYKQTCMEWIYKLAWIYKLSCNVYIYKLAWNI